MQHLKLLDLQGEPWLPDTRPAQAHCLVMWSASAIWMVVLNPSVGGGAQRPGGRCYVQSQSGAQRERGPHGCVNLRYGKSINLSIV